VSKAGRFKFRAKRPEVYVTSGSNGLTGFSRLACLWRIDIAIHSRAIWSKRSRSSRFVREAGKSLTVARVTDAFLIDGHRHLPCPGKFLTRTNLSMSDHVPVYVRLPTA